MNEFHSKITYHRKKKGNGNEKEVLMKIQNLICKKLSFMPQISPTLVKIIFNIGNFNVPSGAKN
jgi:hypothetical protein